MDKVLKLSETEFKDKESYIRKEYYKRGGLKFTPNLFIAGGQLVNIIKGIEIRDSDFDYFYIHPLVRNIEKELLEIKNGRSELIDNLNINNSIILSELESDIILTSLFLENDIKLYTKNKSKLFKIYTSYNAITIIYKKVKYQLIKKIFTSVTDLFDSFDMDVCKIAMDQNEIYVTEKFLESIRTNTIIENWYKATELKKIRITKYIIDKNFNKTYPIDKYIIKYVDSKKKFLKDETKTVYEYYRDPCFTKYSVKDYCYMTSFYFRKVELKYLGQADNVDKYSMYRDDKILKRERCLIEYLKTIFDRSYLENFHIRFDMSENLRIAEDDDNEKKNRFSKIINIPLIYFDADLYKVFNGYNILYPKYNIQ